MLPPVVYWVIGFGVASGAAFLGSVLAWRRALVTPVAELTPAPTVIASAATVVGIAAAIAAVLHP